MSTGGHRRTGLRRFAASNTMIVLGLLLALLLPLHGLAGAAASIQSPAHYHSRVQHHAAPRHQMKAHSQGADHIGQHINTATDEHGHGHTLPTQHEPHGVTHRQDDNHDISSTHHDNDDDHADAHKGQPGSAVGHHGHALDAVDVVYVDAASEQPERGTTGALKTLSADTMLPGWWMASMPALGAQILPEPGCDFDSHTACEHRRPPSAEAGQT